MSQDDNPIRESGALRFVNFGGYDAETTDNFELIERRKKHFAGSFLFYYNPIHIVRGQGAYLFDTKGRRYIDCYNNVQSMGHANPTITDAITKQTATLTTHTRYLNENVIEAAEEIAITLPADLDVCLFVCTGTEACELSMRIARVITGSSGSIVMEHSYHGNSKLAGEMSTATYPSDRQPPWIKTLVPPNTYSGPYRHTDLNEEELARRYADLIDPAIDELNQNGEGLAAFVCDSIFDSQGTLEAPKDYFQHIYRKVRAAGGLCIADEVQAGVCRTGKFWGFEHYDVVPDIVFTGKPLGSGFPVAAVFTTRAIADIWAKSDAYFNTFGGNPVAAIAVKSTIRYARENNIPAHTTEVGNYLKQELYTLAEKHKIIGDIQGLGLFIGVELVTDRVSREPASDIARLIPDAMKNEGILVGLTGRRGNRLKFRPPLVYSKKDADETISALDRVLDRLTAPSSESKI